MSDEFKGIAGGDPSRRPPLQTVSYHCVICKKKETIETSQAKSFNPPETCSTECASTLNRNRAMALVREVLGNAPKHDAIPQAIAEELLKAQMDLKLAKKRAIRRVEINCKHCGRTANKFVPHNARGKNAVGRYCSDECRASAAAKLPFGVVCRAPRKSAYSTLEEAELSAARFNAMPKNANDTEGITPYECTCGQWHSGHVSKNEWMLATKAAIQVISDQTLARITAKR